MSEGPERDMNRGKSFPIMGGPSIPWIMIEPHEKQALDNHGGQTLQRLAERGGLSPSEALCVLDDQKWRDSPWGNYMGDKAKDKAAHDELERRRIEFEEYGPEYVDKLQQDIDERNVEISKLNGDIQIMVRKAADKDLGGYRELGAKCAELEGQIDDLKNQLRMAKTIESSGKPVPVQEIAETLSILVHRQILINEGVPEEEAFIMASQQASTEWELWYPEAVTFAARFGIQLISCRNGTKAES